MKNNNGSILAIVIIFIFIFTLLGMFAMRLVILQNETSDSELYYTRAHFAALYGSELALYHIMQWENIATSATYVYKDSYGNVIRKFLPKDSNCFSYDGSYWYPLKNLGTIEDKFMDSITGGTDSGIYLECHVEEEKPQISDGIIPSISTTTTSGKYGTYKFYVIKTTATMYSNYDARTGEIAQAKDELHFFIAYSSGPFGARARTSLTNADGTTVPALPSDAPEYVQSAPRISVITGTVQPVFRYYIRGRR